MHILFCWTIRTYFSLYICFNHWTRVYCAGVERVLFIGRVGDRSNYIVSHRPIIPRLTNKTIFEREIIRQMNIHYSLRIVAEHLIHTIQIYSYTCDTCCAVQVCYRSKHKKFTMKLSEMIWRTKNKRFNLLQSIFLSVDHQYFTKLIKNKLTLQYK